MEVSDLAVEGVLQALQLGPVGAAVVALSIVLASWRYRPICGRAVRACGALVTGIADHDVRNSKLLQ